LLVTSKDTDLEINAEKTFGRFKSCGMYMCCCWGCYISEELIQSYEQNAEQNYNINTANKLF